METVSLFSYHAKTVSTDADLPTLLGAVWRIKFHMTALQETKSKRSDVQHGDETLVVRGESVPSRKCRWCWFVAHPSDVYLADSRELLPRGLAILCLQPLRQNPSSSAATNHHQQLMKSNWTCSVRIWRK
ncbi:hypothetical protein RB195_013723 [Necator americanus]|uniref:Uncharacterized protein n=1 Tax=Necator americanus TaxID=51031 RepID=A0ABR1DWX9_NECAM